MTISEIRLLQSEVSTLEQLLADIPAEEVIERMGLESRKQEIEEILAANPLPEREPVQARLTFRGKPVVGSYGIRAEFGAKAIDAFSKAVVTLASRARPARSRGGDEPRLLITGTATGSFGFELQEAPLDDGALYPKESVVGPAIRQAKAILRATLGSDEALTEAVSEADPRALDALRRFVDTLEKSEAVCALEFGDDVFRYADSGEVKRSLARIAPDNIHEEEVELLGAFLGALPHKREFEFQIEQTAETIVGRVDEGIEDPDEINGVRRRPVRVVVRTRRAGEGRPRYALLRYALVATAPGHE